MYKGTELYDINMFILTNYMSVLNNINCIYGINIEIK
jgi:hypothetical protein